MEDKEELDYKVQLVTTPCNLGGLRYWFVCPLVVNDRPCGKRVGKLYLPPGGKYFGCRSCYNLTYQSQKEHDKRVDAIIENPEILLPKISSKNFKDVLAALNLASKAQAKAEKETLRFFSELTKHPRKSSKKVVKMLTRMRSRSFRLR